MGKLREFPRWRHSPDYEKPDSLGKMMGGKDSPFSHFSIRRLRRRRTRAFALTVLMIVLIPTYLALSFLYQRKYMSDGLHDEVTTKATKPPKTNPGLPPGIPDLPGVYVAPTVDDNQLHALAAGTLDKSDEDDGPMPPSRAPKPLKPGQRPGPPIVKPNILKEMPEMPFKTDKPEEREGPAVDVGRPMPPPAQRPNIHGMPVPGTQKIPFQLLAGQSSTGLNYPSAAKPVGPDEYRPPGQAGPAAQVDAKKDDAPETPDVPSDPYSEQPLPPAPPAPPVPPVPPVPRPYGQTIAQPPASGPPGKGAPAPYIPPQQPIAWQFPPGSSNLLTRPYSQPIPPIPQQLVAPGPYMQYGQPVSRPYMPPGPLIPGPYGQPIPAQPVSPGTPNVLAGGYPPQYPPVPGQPKSPLTPMMPPAPQAAPEYPLEGAPPPPPESPPPIVYTPPAGKHSLVIILAVEGPTPNICKNILSGMANGYPSPVIVNWNSVGKRQIKTEQGKIQMAKIDAILEYLDTMMHPSAHKEDRLKPDDLIVLVDPSDSWWQLPPELLIKRYHESNKLASERIVPGTGSPGMGQTIIAAAQKRCWPDLSTELNMHCDALPGSPAPTDLYGPETDSNVLESVNPDVYKFTRPKFLNSGHIMGPALDMASYLRRAQNKMSKLNGWKPDFKWDQGALGLIFGEQELWRTWLRSEQDFKADNPAMKMAVDGFEYHLGLDYEQKISIPAVAGQKDGQIIKLGRANVVAEASKKLGISPAKIEGVPEDINSTANPLEALLGEEMVITWGEMSLYTDLHSAAVPVIVHNNEWKNRGREGRVARMWDQTWFFPHLRYLVKKYMDKRTAPPILAQMPADGYKLASYWPLPSETTKRKPRKFTANVAIEGLPEMEWEDLCHAGADGRPWFEEVFRDGLGPLEAT